MLGALISAGANLAGSIIGGNQAYKRQKKFAQSAIQWKVRDAKKAGVSPLFALGAPTTSYQPQSVGNVGSGIAAAGQDIGRAVDATSSNLGRARGVAGEVIQAQLEGLRIDNDIKRAELASRLATRGQPGTPPGYPDGETQPHIPGQGNATAIEYKKRIAPAGSVPQKSFGVSPEVDMYRTRHGYSPEVPTDLGEAQESQPLAAMQWFMRNKLAPGFSKEFWTLPFPAPKGKYWSYSPVTGQYVLRKVPDNFPRGPLMPLRRRR